MNIDFNLEEWEKFRNLFKTLRKKFFNKEEENLNLTSDDIAEIRNLLSDMHDYDYDFRKYINSLK